MSINEKLFSYLNEKKLKQSDLASYLKVSTGLITNWKTRGTDPPAALLINICKFLGISIYDLLDEEPEDELLKLYKKLDPKDKEIVDNILDRYRKNDEKTSYTSKIG